MATQRAMFLLLTATILAVAGAFSPGSVSAQGGSLNLPNFQFTGPDTGRWTSTLAADGADGVSYSLREGDVFYVITLTEYALEPADRRAAASTVATRIREHERYGMEKLGVRDDLYKLKNLSMGEETVNGHFFYTMKYSTKSAQHFENARLYLYFPRPSGNDHFFLAHYSEAAPSRSLLTASHEREFLSVLASVTYQPSSGSSPGTATVIAEAGGAQDIKTLLPKSCLATQSALPRDRMRKACQVKINGAYFTFVETPETDVAWLALSPKRMKKPGYEMLTRFPDNYAGRGTMDWMYILDRNGDGKIDYLIYLIGDGPVAPYPCDQPLPNLNEPFTGQVLKETVLPNVGRLFWHVADDNFDGRIDGAAVPLLDASTGWIDGWMLARDTTFDGIYDECRHYQGPFSLDLGACEGTASDYRVAGRQTFGLEKMPPRNDRLLEVINRAVADCGIRPEQLRKSIP